MMDERRALSRAGDEEGARLLLAPTVGRYLDAPAPGSFLAPGSRAGLFRVLRHTMRLVVPPDCSGIVREVLVTGRAPAVEYRQPLLLLGRSAEPADLAPGGFVTEAPGGAEGVPEGAIAVRSPTDGIFYRRPSPEDLAYVEEGDVVEPGKVLGLVEVMKCFNQIVWKGDVVRAKVARILSRDSGEVRLGQVLFVLEPL
jgi:acetyl-CoA carboxylase biotin carboxyl carrier protein